MKDDNAKQHRKYILRLEVVDKQGNEMYGNVQKIFHSMQELCEFVDSRYLKSGMFSKCIIHDVYIDEHDKPSEDGYVYYIVPVTCHHK